MVKKEEFLFDSRDGKSRIHAVRWVPEGKICCILQVVHGMAEFVERYEPMAMYLGEKGIMVTGEDHLGHALAALLQAPLPVKGRNGLRHIKAAIRRKTVENCLSAVNGGGHSPGRNVIHSKTSCIFAQKKWKTKGKHCISLQLHFS